MEKPSFEGISYPWSRKDAQEFHESLHRTVSVPARIEMLYRKCGNGVSPVNFHNPPDLIWKDVLDALVAGKSLRKFCEVVRREKSLKALHPAVDRILNGCDATPYVDYIRQQTGLIELSRISDSKRNDVAIDKLWIPSKVRLAGAGSHPLAEGKKAKRSGKRPPEQMERGLGVTAVEQAVNEHRLLLIRGEAGTGKSLLLKRIAWALVREKRETREKQLKLAFQGLPIWVQISALDKFIENQKAPVMKEDDPLWIPQFFEELAHQQHWTGLDAAFFEEQLQNPEAILLLDGLDEASSSHGRKRIGQLFKKAADAFQCRIIVTTRPEAGVPLPSGSAYAIADLLELDDADIAHFIKYWAASVASADAEKLNDNLKKLGPRSDLRKLARNPQMLTILAILSHGNRLPEHRAAALDQIVTALASARYHSHREAETFLERVSYLALGMILRPSGKYQIELETAAAEIMPPLFSKPAAVAAARTFLEEAQIKSGLLTLRGTGDLVFTHKLFQEFLAARGLTNEEDTLRGAIQVIRERQSPEVIRFLPGKSISGSNRIKGVIKGLIDDASGKDLATQAYTAGIVGSMLRDGFELGESAGGCYAELLERVNRIFDAKEAANIDVKTRLAAAEALAQGGQLPPLPKDDAYWVRIEGTPAFRRGAQKMSKDEPNYDEEAYDWETPAKNPVAIATFELGKYPVTVHEYQCYLADDARNKGAKSPGDWDQQLEHPSRPVVHVLWKDVSAYCEWLTRTGGRVCRLPSEDEWEFAARGEEQRKYPWSNSKPTPHHANFSETGLGHTTPVGLFPAGATREGLLDMAGNIYEWTASDYAKGRRVLRGGAFGSDTGFLRAASRGSNPPDDRYVSIGFRCVREVPVP